MSGPHSFGPTGEVVSEGHTDRDGNRGSRRKKGGTKDTGTIMERGQYVRSDDE